MTLKKDGGVLLIPKRSVRKVHDEVIISNVISFCLNDEFSGEMAGAKENISKGY